MITPWPLAIPADRAERRHAVGSISAGILGGIGMAIATVGLLLLAFLPAQLSHFDLVWRMRCAAPASGCSWLQMRG